MYKHIKYYKDEAEHLVHSILNDAGGCVDHISIQPLATDLGTCTMHFFMGFDVKWKDDDILIHYPHRGHIEFEADETECAWNKWHTDKAHLRFKNDEDGLQNRMLFAAGYGLFFTLAYETDRLVSPNNATRGKAIYFAREFMEQASMWSLTPANSKMFLNAMEWHLNKSGWTQGIPPAGMIGPRIADPDLVRWYRTPVSKPYLWENDEGDICTCIECQVSSFDLAIGGLMEHYEPFAMVLANRCLDAVHFDYQEHGTAPWEAKPNTEFSELTVTLCDAATAEILGEWFSTEFFVGRERPAAMDVVAIGENHDLDEVDDEY